MDPILPITLSHISKTRCFKAQFRIILDLPSEVLFSLPAFRLKFPMNFQSPPRVLCVLPVSLSNGVISYIIFGEHFFKTKLADSSFIIVALFAVCGFDDGSFYGKKRECNVLVLSSAN
jgi:hypothetical protein